MSGLDQTADRFQKGWIAILIGVFTASAIGTFKVVEQTIVVPLRDQVAMLQRDLDRNPQREPPRPAGESDHSPPSGEADGIDFDGDSISVLDQKLVVNKSVMTLDRGLVLKLDRSDQSQLRLSGSIISTNSPFKIDIRTDDFLPQGTRLVLEQPCPPHDVRYEIVIEDIEYKSVQLVIRRLIGLPTLETVRG